MAKSKTKVTKKSATKKVAKKATKTVAMDAGVEQRLDEQLRLIAETQKSLGVISELYETLSNQYDSLAKQIAETEDDIDERMDALEARYAEDHDDSEDDEVDEEPEVFVSSNGVYVDSVAANAHAESETEYSDPTEDGPTRNKGFSDPDSV